MSLSGSIVVLLKQHEHDERGLLIMNKYILYIKRET